LALIPAGPGRDPANSPSKKPAIFISYYYYLVDKDLRISLK
jgi:hypothetical protein